MLVLTKTNRKPNADIKSALISGPARELTESLHTKVLTSHINSAILYMRGEGSTPKKWTKVLRLAKQKKCSFTNS